MPVVDISNLFNIYDVLTSTKDADTGTIMYQLGNVTNSEVNSDGAESWSHFGFASRPSEVQPSADDAPQVISIARSDRDLVVAERDVRGQEIYGQLSAGETCLYAAGQDATGQARILLKQDGGINLYSTQGNTSAGQGMGIFINAQEDSITIMNSKGLGIRIDNTHGISIVGKGGNCISLDTTFVIGGDVQIGNLDIGGSLSVAGQCGITGTTQFTGAVTVAGITTLAGPTVINPLTNTPPLKPGP
jgi:hypothetical protein